MPYCTQTDLENKITKQKLAELTNDFLTQGINNQQGAEPDTDVVTALIAETDQDIDSIVGMRYTVPFVIIPDSIKFLSVNITCYRAFRRKLGANKMTQDWLDTYKEAMQELQDIANGLQFIGVTNTISAGIAIAPTSEKQTDFYDSTNSISKY